jgi:hypothetical protein
VCCAKLQSLKRKRLLNNDRRLLCGTQERSPLLRYKEAVGEFKEEMRHQEVVSKDHGDR